MSKITSALIAIRLLILSNSRDQTRIIEASLRNGGLAVHCTQIFETKEIHTLENMLREQTFDLLLCSAFDKDVDPFHVLDVLEEQDLDLPVLILFSAQNGVGGLLQALRKGARDLIDKN
ncbi:hypothetical protein TI03_04225, partial [Achromatium sp. WMS1]